MALGLGAFGETFANCQGRFGEFLAVAGAVACQPTDGANYPDHMLSSGAFVPQLSALYGLCCDGDFQNLVRFESASGKDPVPLSQVVESCLETIQAETAGVVIVAESAGLLGAVLKRSPVRNGESSHLFAYPEIRCWLSFSPERCYPRALVLIAGVVSTSPPADLGAVFSARWRRAPSCPDTFTPRLSDTGRYRRAGSNCEPPSAACSTPVGSKAFCTWWPTIAISPGPGRANCCAAPAGSAP